MVAAVKGMNIIGLLRVPKVYREEDEHGVTMEERVTRMIAKVGTWIAERIMGVFHEKASCGRNTVYVYIYIQYPHLGLVWAYH